MPRTLWVLVCRGQYTDALFTLYATDAQDAERQAERIEKEKGYSGKRVSLKEHSHGFKLAYSELPGTLPETAS